MIVAAEVAIEVQCGTVVRLGAEAVYNCSRCAAPCEMRGEYNERDKSTVGVGGE